MSESFWVGCLEPNNPHWRKVICARCGKRHSITSELTVAEYAKITEKRYCGYCGAKMLGGIDIYDRSTGITKADDEPVGFKEFPKIFYSRWVKRLRKKNVGS